MSNRIKNNLDYLKILGSCKTAMRKAIIENADKDLVYTLCECVLNCLNGNVPINDSVKNKLKRHRKVLREVLKKKSSSIIKKKSILIQKGGAFLPLIIPTIMQTIRYDRHSYHSESDIDDDIDQVLQNKFFSKHDKVKMYN